MPAIPFVEKARTEVSEYERLTVKELYEKIMSEMEEAVPQLEDRPDHNMRVYMTTGYALLGKMYWMMGEYEKALKYLRTAKERLANETFCYFHNYDEVMAKYDYKELTLRQVYGENGSKATQLINYSWADPEILFVKQNSMYMGPFYAYYYGSPTYYISQKTYDLFDEHDLRRNLIPTDGHPYPLGCMRDASVNYGVSLSEVYLPLAECEARVGSDANARQVLKEFRSYRMRAGYEDVPESVKTKEDLIKFCIDEEHREWMAQTGQYYNIRRIWSDPLFQDKKPYSRTDGVNTYTMTENSLWIEVPESVYKWNENWR